MTSDQLKQLEADLWSAADQLRANSDLGASEYGTPVLGLIFLKFADINYRRHEQAIQEEFEQLKGTRREKPIHEIAIAKCGFYLPGHARYSTLLNLPEDRDIAKAIEMAMESIEKYKPELAGSLPKDEYYRLTPLDSLATRQMLPMDHYNYTAAQSSLALFEKGDILFGAMRPYQHKVVVAPFNGVTRTTMFVIRPKKDYLHAYCYLNLFQNSSIEYATLICNGADRPYVVWNRAMERMKVFLSKEGTLTDFEKMAGPSLTSTREFYFIQRKLAEARDFLLPRLISGKLSVENLDIQFPPSMRADGVK